MGVKGKRERGISKQMVWSDTPIADKDNNHSWSQDATNVDLGLLYRLYYDNNKKNVYLYDFNNDVTYEVPYGAKAKGYTLAFKLFIKTV